MRRDRRTIEVQDQKQKRRQKYKRTTKHLRGDPQNHAKEREPQNNTPGLHDPCMNTEDSERRSIKKISAGGNQFEKVAI
jgi:hypothetical protein